MASFPQDVAGDGALLTHVPSLPAFTSSRCSRGERSTIRKKIFEPWQQQLEGRGVVVRAGSRVSSIEKDDGGYAIRLDSEEGGEDSIVECDVVVLAVGATAAGRLASSSPAISSLAGSENFDKLISKIRNIGKSKGSQAQDVTHTARIRGNAYRFGLEGGALLRLLVRDPDEEELDTSDRRWTILHEEGQLICAGILWGKKRNNSL